MRKLLSGLGLVLAVACGSSESEPEPQKTEPTCEETCRADGKLCEAGACVLPWRYGSPTFDQCEGEPRRTTESLKQKADWFEETARRFHIHPKLGWATNVKLKATVSEANATYDDVESWESGENDGLWSALYLGAEAYRWAVTHDPEALDTILLMLDSEEKRMRITGVPGIFTRQMIPPGVSGIACPSDPKDYVPDDNKDSNRWVRVGTGGCLETVDGTTLEWKTSKVCGLSEFAGWCFLDNVSEDEYAGHMFALGALAKLVTDASVQPRVKALLAKVGDHLIENELTFRDWDGRVTEHGKIWAWKLMGGYNAAMSLSFIKTVELATGDEKYKRFYDDCLLQKSGPNLCITHYGATDKPYDEVLSPVGLNMGCKANWNNYSMYMLSLHGLLWGEHEPGLRSKLQAVLHDEMWYPPDEPRPLSEQNNPWFDFIYAAGKALGPESDGPAYDAVKNGICQLRQFPASKTRADVTCPPDKCVEVCKDRFDNPMTDYPRPVAERCVSRFEWWGTPYSTTGCTADPTYVYSPADYLAAYWMGRYYGFIGPDS